MSGCMRSAENCGAPIMRSGSSGEPSLRIGTSNSAPFTPGKQIWRRSALRWGECAGVRASDGKDSGAALPKLQVNSSRAPTGRRPERHAARLRLRFIGEAPRGDFSVDFLSEKDNPCYDAFSVLKYDAKPFGIWRTRIWKMAAAEPIEAGEADGKTESPGNGAATL